eukprot:11060319-Lingulodinium_polyedra.AAC.1
MECRDDTPLGQLGPSAAPRCPVPPAKSEGWTAWCRAISRRVAGLDRARLTPTAVWRLLHEKRAPLR